MKNNQLSRYDAKNYVFSHSGNSNARSTTITLHNPVTGHRHTYKIKYQKAKGGWGDKFFVSAMTGPDNEKSYTYIGFINPNDKTTLIKGGKGQDPNPDTFVGKSVIYFNWLLRQLYGKGEQYNQVEVLHSGRCGRCGKKLTVPESIESGIGPECAKIMGLHTHRTLEAIN